MKHVFLLAALIGAAPVAAQMQAMRDMPGMPMPTAKGACPKPVIVPGFESWAHGPGLPQLKVGEHSDLVLAPAEDVKFSPPLNRAPAPGSMGGVYGLTLTKAGTYRFALSAGAWLDVVDSRSQRMPSAAHMHGPDCSGITKIVDYQLDPGVYVVQFSATDQARLQVMLIGQ